MAISKEVSFSLAYLFWMLILEINTLPDPKQEQELDYRLGSCIWVTNRKCPDEDVKFYLFTKQNLWNRQNIYIDETWERSNLSYSHFDPRHPVKIIIHGYNSDMNLNSLVKMKNEYLKWDNYNIIFVDWSKLSSGPPPCYLSAVHNCGHVGTCIGQLIERIIDSGTDDIHIIGFSLGGQLTNFVAKSLKPFVIPRITGLDPAMPGFLTASKSNKLDSSDAAFVDVIHTNAFTEGTPERSGHVDFFMNGGVKQPGCTKIFFGCSHQRAAEYFAESINSLKGFWGWPCSSYINYIVGLCRPTRNLIEAGEDCEPESRGMYFVSTNSHSPYARGK